MDGQRLPLLEEALIKADSSAPEVISSIIGRFSQMPNLKKNSAYHRYDYYSSIINYFNRGLEIR